MLLFLLFIYEKLLINNINLRLNNVKLILILFIIHDTMNTNERRELKFIMAYQVISHCPVCSETLKITKLHCSHCHTTIENEFELSKLASLSNDQLRFVEVFLTCRGNIKEVEKELGISYPTVRGKLNEVVSSLGFETKKKNEVDEKKVVAMLESGEITPEEAIKLLKDE